MSDDTKDTYMHLYFADGSTIGPMNLPGRKRVALVRQKGASVLVLGYFLEGNEEAWEENFELGVGYLDKGDEA